MIEPMTTASQEPTSRRWLLPFLAALVAALATLLSSASASAATTPSAETRVRASQSVATDIARPPDDVRAGQRLGEAADRVVTVVATGVAANTTTRVADDAFEHGYKYHPRIRERGLEDPRAHNFPYSFDDVILREKPITQADGSLLYRKPGDVSGRSGVYEIALNPDTGIIFHRTWRRTP